MITDEYLLVEIPRKPPILRQRIYRFPNGRGLSVVLIEDLWWESCPIWEIEDSGKFGRRDDPDFSGTEDEMSEWIRERAAESITRP